MLLSIVVVSFNTRELTLECLRSVFRETQETMFELLVLDNASSDGSAEAIEQEFGTQVRLIKSSCNLGFAAGNNHAVELAQGDFVLLLNPDTVILDRAIDRLMDFSHQYPAAGIWGGRTLFGDGSLNPSSCWSKQSLWSLVSQALGLNSIFRHSPLFNPEAIGGWNREGVRKVDIVSGCFFLISKELWSTLKGFDPVFFMYGEEADLCLRAATFGVTPMVTSTATIIHYGGASEKVKADKLVRLLRAKMRLIQRHFPLYSRCLGILLLSLWPLSRAWACRVIAFFRSSSQNRAQVWSDVSRRRKEWSI